MIEITWETGYCEYEFEDPTQPAGQVKVTTLHWSCNGLDTDTQNTGRSIGTVNAADQNRVYTLAALQAVPASVMTDWVHQAMGDEEVTEVEANVTAQVEQANTPPTGGFTPEE